MPTRSPQARGAATGIRSPQHWLCWQLGITAGESQSTDVALQQARDALFHLHNEASEPESDVKVTGWRVSWADALTEIARRSLDGDESPSRRERFRVNLFLNLDSDIRADWEDRSAVPDFLIDKITCDRMRRLPHRDP